MCESLKPKFTKGKFEVLVSDAMGDLPTAQERIAEVLWLLKCKHFVDHATGQHLARHSHRSRIIITPEGKYF